MTDTGVRSSCEASAANERAVASARAWASKARLTATASWSVSLRSPRSGSRSARRAGSDRVGGGSHSRQRPHPDPHHELSQDRAVPRRRDRRCSPTAGSGPVRSELRRRCRHTRINAAGSMVACPRPFDGQSWTGYPDGCQRDRPPGTSKLTSVPVVDGAARDASWVGASWPLPVLVSGRSVVINRHQPERRAQQRPELVPVGPLWACLQRLARYAWRRLVARRSAGCGGSALISRALVTELATSPATSNAPRPEQQAKPDAGRGPACPAPPALIVGHRAGFAAACSRLRAPCAAAARRSWSILRRRLEMNRSTTTESPPKSYCQTASRIWDYGQHLTLVC